MAAGYRRIFGNTLRSANLGRNARHACLDVGLALLLPFFSVMRDRAGLCADGVRVVARLSCGLYLCHGLVLLVTGAFLAIPFVLRIWAAMHVMRASTSV